MKKIFLAGAVIACLLFALFDDDTEKVPRDTETVAVETQAVAANEVTPENVSAVNPAADKSKPHWDGAPRFNNQIELVNYLNKSRKNLQTFLPVVLTDGFVPDVNELVTVAPILYLQATNYGGDGQTTYMVYEITNYPGERVAWAYLNNDTSILNDEERELYDAAVQIVNAAKNFSSNPLYRELHIHDAITERVTYHNENPQPVFARFKTAAGALLDGRANCQGYADAFYMLATMCGLNVDKINGYGNGEYHVWNTITFGDATYFVDVTWDDASFSFADSGEYNTYIYFNAPTDIMTTHKWFSDYSPKNLRKKPDGRYFYYTPEFGNTNGKYFGGYSNSAEEALAFIAQRIARDGHRMSWMCTPVYDARYADVNNAFDLLTQKLLPNVYHWSGYVKINVVTRGNYIFFTVDATPQ